MKLALVLVIVSFSAWGASFDASLGVEMYSYMRPTYCNVEKLPNWDCTPCQEHQMQEVQVFFNATHDAQGYCGYDAGKDRVVLAIRGTVDYKNWLSDFDTIKTSYDCDGCKVHEGFYKIYQDLANNLLACAYTLTSNHPTAEVFVTGHSLGAAQSTFAAIEINKSIKPVSVFYNFGSPRVGNKAFAEYVGQQLSGRYIARIIHWKDEFVHLPNQETGFEHIGHQIFYDEGFDSYQECTAEDRSCSGQFRWPWQWSIKDHLFYYLQCAGCEETSCDKYK